MAARRKRKAAPELFLTAVRACRDYPPPGSLKHLDHIKISKSLENRIFQKGDIGSAGEKKVLVAEMGGVKLSNQPSLERLKALNSLPDLPSQLAEANRQCTHNARAEMIAKWLLEKMKSTQEIRTNVEAWQSLHSAMRLLLPERLAMLLSSHTFTITLCLVLEEAQTHESLLETLADLINLLIDVSHSPNGAAITAVLSVPAGQAASLMGFWLQGVVHRAKALQYNAQSQAVYSLLRPILQIWTLRKPSTDENYLFAKHCLVPTSRLLSMIASEGQGTANKRKRCHRNGDSNYSAKEAVETLLARHVFLPARTAFFKAESSMARTGHQVTNSQDRALTIENVLVPLKNACVEVDEEGRTALETLPLLLGIALRCVATPTPRQRTKERPWTEAIFEALHACNRNHTGEILSVDVLIMMLEVVGARAALSRETLEKIVRLYCVPALSPSEVEVSRLSSSERWRLTAQVVKLGDDLFTDPKIAKHLFEWIAESSEKDYESAANEYLDLRHDNGLHSSIHEWPTFLLKKILVPILNAFGRSRNLPTFVEIWSKQMQHEAQRKMGSVWSRLDEPFQSIVEDSLSSDQIIDLFDRLSKTVADTSHDESFEEATRSPSKIGPPIVILNGILGGLQDESLLNNIVPKCEQLLVHLFERFDGPGNGPQPNSHSITHEKRIWALIRIAFELWFPPWAAAQSDNGLVAEKCSWLISRTAIKCALAAAQPIRSSNNANTASTREPSDAEFFVATLCHHVAAYKDNLELQMQKLLEQTLENLFLQLDPNHLQAISVHPTLLLHVRNADIRSEFLGRVIKAAATTSDENSMTAPAVTGLQSLITEVTTNIQRDVIDDLIRLAVGSLDRTQKDEEEDDEQIPNRLEVAIIGVLSDIPVGLLTRVHREKILDALTLPDRIKSHSDQESRRRRLALMVRLMELPNATSQLSTDRAVIWRIALGVDVYQFLDNAVDVGFETDEAKTLTLMEELARLTVKHLLTTQDQERSRLCLHQLSSDVKFVLEIVLNPKLVHGGKAILLSVCKAIMQGIEKRSKDNLKEHLPHRNPQLLRTFCDQLLDTITDTISVTTGAESDPLDSVTIIELNAMVDTLAIATELFTAATDGDTSYIVGNVVKVSFELLETLSKVDALRNAEPTTYHATLVRSFETCCKHVSTESDWPFAVIALRLLDMQLIAAAMEALMFSFEARLDKLRGPTVVSLIEQLLPSEETGRRSNVLLLQKCLARLDRDEVTIAAGSVQSWLLPRLLSVLIESDDLLIRQRATSCILLALREKPFLINQHAVDKTLASLHKPLNEGSMHSIAYLSSCQIMSALLLSHRARLQGRFDLVNSVYETLITKLFRSVNAPPSNRAAGKQFGPKHARACARALILYCEPPMMRWQTNTSGLTDESRKEQAHVGQFVQDVLHHYCSQVLNGSLGEGMKEALIPGLWAMVEAIQMNDADGMKHLSAAMNNSERAVLRGVYDDWKRFGKWRGG